MVGCQRRVGSKNSVCPGRRDGTVTGAWDLRPNRAGQLNGHLADRIFSAAWKPPTAKRATTTVRLALFSIEKSADFSGLVLIRSDQGTGEPIKGP